MTTPNVQYGYTDGSGNTIRPVSMTYPNGRVITYEYGMPSGINDAAARVEKIVDDDDTVLAQYEYLGLGTPVTVDYTEPQVKYTLVGTAGGNDPDTGDIYRGLDRFGRVKDSYWYDYGSLADAARIQYGYDRASNRTYRKDPVAESYSKGFDELYSYDGLHRLKDLQRGTLNAQRTAINNGTFAECWSLDPTGNWKGYRRDDNGASAWDLVQARTTNKVNEIAGLGNAVGPAWTQPSYDAAGNMTTFPQPAEPTKAYAAAYDAWNRLTTLADTDTDEMVIEHQYDPRQFRTVSKSYTAGMLSETRHRYDSSRWQRLEERLGTNPESEDPERQFVWGPRHVDDLILRDRNINMAGALDEHLYALQDANWNVVGTADVEGVLRERFAYSAYGVPAFLTSTFGTIASNSGWEVLYCAYTYSAMTASFSVRNREYSAILGCWNQRDIFRLITRQGHSIGDRAESAPKVPPHEELTQQFAFLEDEAVSAARLLFVSDPSHQTSVGTEIDTFYAANLYEYAGSNPLSRLDPFGRQWYGNYCGPNSLAGPPVGPPPIDALDQCCLDHDICYGRAGARWWRSLPFCSTPVTTGCDRTLCTCATGVTCAGRRCAIARRAVMRIFC